MAGVGCNQEAVLAALEPGQCLTVDHLAGTTGLTNRKVVSAAAVLITRGFADRAERGCFTITPAGEAFRASGEPIRSGPRGPLTMSAARRPARVTLRDHLWAAMRIRSKFTINELLEVAATGEDAERDPRGNAQRYVKALHEAGYLRLLPHRAAGTAPTSNGFRRWALIRDTGPATPVHQKAAHQVYDPNTRETFALRAQEASDGQQA